jgi:hypothetical protein
LALGGWRLAVDCWLLAFSFSHLPVAFVQIGINLNRGCLTGY